MNTLNTVAMFGEKTAAENGDGILAEIKIQEVLIWVFIGLIRISDAIKFKPGSWNINQNVVPTLGPGVKFKPECPFKNSILDDPADQNCSNHSRIWQLTSADRQAEFENNAKSWRSGYCLRNGLFKPETAEPTCHGFDLRPGESILRVCWDSCYGRFLRKRS